MNASEILRELESIAATSATLAKAEKIDRLLDRSELFRWIATQAYDPFIRFGLKPKRATATGSKSLDLVERFADVLLATDILHRLATKKLTGNAARDAVELLLADYDEASSELLWRILSKDLRAGFTVNTLHRLRPSEFPVFSVMLAHSYTDRKHTVRNWPVLVEPKLDGVRAICVIKDDVPAFYTRTGHPMPAVDHIGPIVLSALKNLVKMRFGSADVYRPGFTSRPDYVAALCPSDGKINLVIDGEIVSGAFNKTVSEARRKEEAALDAKFHIFDAFPLAFMHSEADTFDVPLAERLELVNDIVYANSFSDQEQAARTAIVRSNGWVAASHEAIDESYKLARGQGYEGVIVKDPKKGYSKKRSIAWLKIKGQETYDIRITGVVEGEGKYENAIGALIADFNGKSVNIGSGLTDDERTRLWTEYQKDPKSLVGRLIEVECHEVTPDGSLRHPRLIGWRDDKDDTVIAA